MVSFDDPGEAPEAVVVRKDSGKADRPVPGDDDDDSTTSSSSSSSSSGSSSSSSSSSSGTVPAGCEPVDLNAIDCGTKTAPTCGRNLDGTAKPGVADDDLVECPAAGGKPACVRRCANGCVDTGTSNRCNPCGAGGKPDGTYCERDFPGFPPDGVAGPQFAATCTAGKYQRVANCGNGEVLASGPSAGKRPICETTCTRAGTAPKPSCCTTAAP